MMMVVVVMFVVVAASAVTSGGDVGAWMRGGERGKDLNLPCL